MIIIKPDVNTDILTMNKLWIEASHREANRCRQSSWIADGLDKYEYLDTMGLFETSWMVYEFDEYEGEKDRYGYPGR